MGPRSAHTLTLSHKNAKSPRYSQISSGLVVSPGSCEASKIHHRRLSISVCPGALALKSRLRALLSLCDTAHLIAPGDGELAPSPKSLRREIVSCLNPMQDAGGTRDEASAGTKAKYEWVECAVSHEGKHSTVGACGVRYVTSGVCGSVSEGPNRGAGGPGRR